AERSTAMVVGLLAILKAGAAYLPLDPDLPARRLADMIAQSGTRLVLAQAHLLPRLPELEVEIACLEQAPGQAAAAPPPPPHPDSLAYCIFTSGSTGRPKGVGNSHAGLLNRLLWMQARYRLGPDDRVLQKTPFSFDVSVWEFLWPLITGATLVMAPPGAHRDPASLRGLIVREGVTTLHFVPSMLQAFLAAGELPACTSLRRVICSGEALPAGLQRQFLARHPAGLHNLYGPTEAAIDVTAWDCREAPEAATVPIGRPIANIQIHLLDAGLEPVPVGVLGELAIGGIGLARGYLGRPGLTAERFVPDPFGDGARLYRTGDLASRRPDGVIDYAGRRDHQVKLRGLRIELGEIEACLMAHPRVREAVVVAQASPGGRQLVAYLTGTAAPEQLEDHLRASLPDYMIPAHLLRLDALPLSPNGKIDRGRLPAPEIQTPAHAPPVGEIEIKLCQAWQDVLGRQQVGATDNFFELGGDSIVSIQLVSRARQLGLELAPRDIFRHQTVRALATVARQKITAAQRPPASGEAALLPIQHWFFEQPFVDRSHWNQAVLLTPRAAVDPADLERALGVLIDRHDALRLRFEQDGGHWRQFYQPRQALAGPFLRTSSAGDADELAAIVAAAHRSLDIAAGRLLHAELIALPDGGQRLLIVIHHLVVDGVSWRILLEDLHTTYRQTAAPPARTSSTQEWAAALAIRAQTAPDLAWWEAQLAGDTAPLPADVPGALCLNRDAARLIRRLDRSRTELLLKEAPAAYRVRIDELLVAALAQALCRWSGGEAVLIQLEGHGREAQLVPGVDLSRSVGWFTSLFPVRLEAAPDLAADALIKSIKEQLRAVPDSGLGHGLLRHLAPADVQARMQALPAPEITFNYLGRFDSSFAGDAAFLPAPESSGDGLAPDSPMISPLTLEGQILGGELSLVWSYGTRRYRAETIQALAQDVEATLHRLIAHCVSAWAGGITPSDFPLAGLSQAQLDALPFPARHIEDVFPLAPMQEGLLMHTLLEPESGIYLMQEHYFIDSALDAPTFLRAWRQVLTRNAALRATFHWNTGGPAVQVILRDPEIELSYVDWVRLPATSQEERLEAILAAELREGFDLRLTPPFRLRLIRLAAERFCFVLSYHHILMDAWSRSQLMEDLMAVHRDLLADRAPPPRTAATYRDFIAWLTSRDETETRTFWQRTLAGFDEPTPVLTIHPAPQPVEGPVIGDVLLAVATDRSKALRDLALERQITLNTFVQAAWALMLHLYSGRDDVLFGITVAGRPADVAAMQATVGLFISSIPLRVRLPHPATGQSTADWLAELQGQNLAMREHEHLPLVTIAECSELPRGTPLFDSLFVFESEPLNFAVVMGAEELAARADKMRTHTNYPMTVVVYPGERLGLHLSYDRRFFDDAVMPALLERFERVLMALVDGFELPVRELRLLDPAELLRLTVTCNATRRPYPLERGYAPLFRAMVQHHPHRIAAACMGRRLT
ncbi:MAG: amino acid adenylation domain-containing protein, partial [Geminicoccaceae bacterium]